MALDGHPSRAGSRSRSTGCRVEVGSVYYEADDAVVLIDPIVPSEDRERFLDALDRDVERANGRSRSCSPASGMRGAPTSWWTLRRRIWRRRGTRRPSRRTVRFGDRRARRGRGLDGHSTARRSSGPARTLVAGDALASAAASRAPGRLAPRRSRAARSGARTSLRRPREPCSLPWSAGCDRELPASRCSRSRPAASSPRGRSLTRRAPRRRARRRGPRPSRAAPRAAPRRRSAPRPSR